MSQPSILSLQSEPYAPTGNIGDGGFRRLLGTPSLEVLQLVIREAVQNSCDAAKLGRGPDILIRLRTLAPEEVARLRDRILGELPFIAGSRAPLEAFLAGPEPTVLEIADFGTTGLCGPTRADRIPEGTTRTDFSDFLLNVGTQRNTEQGGGTYGFGKSSLYMASRCSTVLVDTLTVDAERRFMGCHLGPSGARGTGDGYVVKYTGRHWWGVRGEDSILEPATGDLARDLACGLGLPDRPSGRSGTTIMVLDPDLGASHLLDDGSDEPAEEAGGGAAPEAGATLEDAAARLAGGLLWNFWPRMMASTPAARRISARVLAGDTELEIPPPEEVPPLDHYCAAMDMIRAGNPEVTTIRKYGRILGRLAIARGLRSPRVPPFDAPGTPFAHPAAGIATMRPVELVVRVEPGSPLPNEALEWAGVFVAGDEADIEEAFARSEPAAHDAWDPATLADESQRKWVRAALRRIRDAARNVGAPEAAHSAHAGEAVPLAAVAGVLGQFLKGLGHGGPTTGGGGRGGGGTSRRRRVSAPVFSRLQLVEEQIVAEFRLELSGQGPQDTLVLTPAFAVEGASVAIDEAAPSERPRIVRALDAEGRQLDGLGRVHVGDLEGEVRVLVTVPADCAVTIKATLEAAA